MAMDKEKKDVRKAALEFMISLKEPDWRWLLKTVRGCLGGIGGLGDDHNFDMWLKADVRPALPFSPFF
jgi:hypothetical protein